MKRFVFALLCAIWNIGFSLAERPLIREKEVIYLVSVKETDVCLAKVDGDWFFARVSDIRLLDMQATEAIEMFLPQDSLFVACKKECPNLLSKVKAVFVIRMRKGGKLPHKFAQAKLRDKSKVKGGRFCFERENNR